jgi:Ycf66 protein N-terminus
MPPSGFALVALLLKRSFRKCTVMLAYILSTIVGTGSVALYLSAFLFPEIHRPKDIFWSGLGLFYALVLWVNGQSLSGGLLLGQTLSVVLLGWFTWETLSLRREIIPANQRTPIPPTPSLNLSSLSKKTAELTDDLQPEPAKNPDKSPNLENPPSLATKIDDLSAESVELVPENPANDMQPWIEIRQEFPKGSNSAPAQPPSE